MLSAISAESLKLRRHRATWSLVWIFPIGLFVIYLVGIAVELMRGSTPDSLVPADIWVRNAAAFWGAPPNTMMRYLIGAFTAVAFGGEYGWNTWKLIVPHRARSTLIGAKYVVTFGLLYAAFALAALVMMGMGWLEDVATGDAIPQGITATALAAAHWKGFVAGVAAVVLTVAYTSLAAILTRSTTAAIIIGIVVATIEELFRSLGPALSYYLPGGVELLYRALPGYHVANLAEWARNGEALVTAPFASGSMLAYGWATSLAIVAAWVVGLMALTFWRFRRQDIN